MTVGMLAELNHWILLASLALHCVLGTSYAWILVQFLSRRRDALAGEARLLLQPLPPDRELPHVLVQIPVFNEGGMVGRIAAAIAQLDWPPDRLHVQILDDSTDGSVAFAEQAVAALRGQRIDAVLLHRRDRAGFKAGALAEGLRLSDHEFVAMFDADYVPPRHFLKSCIRPLLADPSLALAQARCDFLNANENLLTWVQQRILDAHFAIEQAARSWAGQIMPFNGTCGIWRRAAIEEAGGWHGDTLTEDLDLSYRVQLLGWRALILLTVAVPGELPADLRTWMTQQFRWTKGFAEVAWKMLPAVWSSRLSLGQRLISTLHLCAGIFGPLVAVTLVSGAIDLTLGAGLTMATVVLAVIAELEATICAQAIILLGQRQARRADLMHELVRLPIVVWVFGLVQLANCRANIEAFLGYETVFVRTPKRARVSPAKRPAPLHE
jgi:cellulose synthase/poly-beta-1,6-N-acetylglucosamine synthase-like glycosyltransferase